MKTAFLILHYKNIDETKECVKSILNNIKENKSIVIVDNGSNNGTGEELQELYKDNSEIYVLVNKENLGFAKGNNIGFRYIKKNLDADFIYMINSDTVINDSETLSKIYNEYEKSKFDICGPDIILENGVHSNLIMSDINSLKDIKKAIRTIKRNIFLNKIHLEIINVLVSRIKCKLNKKSINKENRMVLTGSMELHGAAIIFSKKFIENYDGLYEGTFLYFEETALRYICQRDKLIVVYNPEIKITHKESKSTKMMFKGYRKRHLFYYANLLNSTKSVKEMISSSNNKTWK